MAVGGNGYRVQQRGMEAEAQKLDAAGDDVGGIAGAVKDTACYSHDVLGGSDAGPAYNNFAGDWQAEAKVLESALHELADKIRTSKARYQGAENAAIGDMSAVGGDGLTTMPAPGGSLPVPGYRTMPAPAGDVPAPGYRTMPAQGEMPRTLSDFD